MKLTNLSRLLIQDGRPLYIIAADLRIHPSTLSLYSRGLLSIRSHHLITLSTFFNTPAEHILGYYTPSPADFTPRPNGRVYS